MKVYAFDNCSILNQMEIKIPNSFVSLIGKNILRNENCQKLKKLCNFLKESGIKKYRFKPSNVE